VLPADVWETLMSEKKDDPVECLRAIRRQMPGLSPILLPYRSVGCIDGGMLIAVRSVWTEIAGNRYEGMYLALTAGQLGEGYTALWGGEIKRGYREGDFEKTVQRPVAVGFAAAKRSSLHWRK